MRAKPFFRVERECRKCEVGSLSQQERGWLGPLFVYVAGNRQQARGVVGGTARRTGCTAAVLASARQSPTETSVPLARARPTPTSSSNGPGSSPSTSSDDALAPCQNLVAGPLVMASVPGLVFCLPSTLSRRLSSPAYPSAARRSARSRNQSYGYPDNRQLGPRD